MGDVTELPPRGAGGASEGRKCGAKTSAGPPCKNPAGYRTEHLGFGRCHRHTGSTSVGNKAAAKEAAMHAALRLGGEVEVEPGEALLEEVRRSAGYVRWLQDRMVAWDAGEGRSEEERLALLRQFTDAGWSKSAIAELYLLERKHLARTCKMALDAGVAERAITLAEDQGRLLANVIQGILRDLNLDAEQQSQAPGIVRRHLTLAAG